MSVEKNETAIQVLKILYSQQKKKKLKKTHYNKVYPRNIEAKYKTKLTNFYKPLVNFVDTFLQENQVQMLRGDSKEIKCDAMPGGTFRRMVQSLEGWVSVYMPTVAEMKEGQNNVIFMGLNQTAEQIKQHEDAQFQKQLQNGIGVSFQTNASWWPNTKASWAQNNYNLITSNARNYISQINTLCEQAVVNGYSVKQLQEQIKKASNGLTDKKCRLIARDQIGKLQGQVSQAQMEEVGLEMYVWETSGDERVRSTHIPMDGLLCRWDDANVYSADGGKHWIPRPANAVKMHPGQDIQCRCIAVAYMPELLYEVSGEKVEDFEIPAVKLSDDEVADKLLEDYKNNIRSKLTVDERGSIKNYTGSGYSAVNKLLRFPNVYKSTDIKQIQQQIEEIKSGISKAEALPFNFTAYRGFDYFDDMKNWKVGEPIDFPEFLSTSVKKEKAFTGDCFMQIDVPAGKKAGMYIADISFNPENEFLFNAGSVLKLLKIEKVGEITKYFFECL